MIHPWYTARYVAYVVKHVFLGTAEVAADAFTPGLSAKPMIVEFPLRCSTDVEISTLASSITITPGTMTLGIAPGGPADEEPARLYVHAMYADTRDDLLADLRELEDRVLRMIRGRGGVS